jgi:hypothetical protein
MTNQPKIGQEVLIHGYIDEIRKDTIIIRNDGGYFGTVEWEVTDIEMPDTNDVLDKIRAEIDELDRYYDNDYFSTNNCPMYKCNEVLLIIDKYRKEIGGENE